MAEQDIPALLLRAADRTFPADYPQRPSSLHGQQLYDEAAALRALAAGWPEYEAAMRLAGAWYEADAACCAVTDSASDREASMKVGASVAARRAYRGLRQAREAAGG